MILPWRCCNKLHYCTIIALQKPCEKPANRRAASDEKPTPDLYLIVLLKNVNIIYGAK